MKALSEINKGNIGNLYLFYGEEQYKRRVYKDTLKKKVPFGNQMNYSYYEGKDIDFRNVYETAMTLPFFAEKRLVIVENCGRFKGKKKGETEDSAETGSAADAAVEKLLAELPETTCLVFFEDSVLKTKKLFKAISKNGVAEECAPDSAGDVKKWVQKGFRSYGLAAEPDAAELLIERSGTDYTTLLHEIEKLAAYCADSKMVSVKAVEEIATHNIESKIFEIMSYMSSKNTQAVLERYYDMLANREEPRMILAMIRRQFRIMLQTSEMAADGFADNEIAGATKNPPFVIKKMRAYLRNFGKEEIVRILDEINRTDMQTKNGELNDQIGVEMLLLRISS